MVMGYEVVHMYNWVSLNIPSLTYESMVCRLQIFEVLISPYRKY